MSGRTVRSGGNDNGSRRSSGSSRKPRTIGSRGNTGRSSKSRAPRSVSSGHEIDEPEIIDDVTVAKGQAGAFVDARRLHSEDYVAETLHQTTGSLGVASRPKVVNFTERAKERKRANVRVVALRVLIAVVSVAVVAGLAWLLLFSSVFRLETSEIGVSGANEWVSAQTIHVIADKQAGKSLFLVSAHEVTEQLKSIPGVSEAKVSKQFPKSMSVEVKAQRPAAMLKKRRYPDRGGFPGACVELGEERQRGWHPGDRGQGYRRQSQEPFGEGDADDSGRVAGIDA